METLDSFDDLADDYGTVNTESALMICDYVDQITRNEVGSRNVSSRISIETAIRLGRCYPSINTEDF